MSFLFELFLELLVPDVGPSSERGLVAMMTASSLALLLTTVWLLADPTPQPEWALPVFAGSVMCGRIGLWVSLLHAARNAADRLFGVLCVIVNAAAVMTPILG